MQIPGGEEEEEKKEGKRVNGKKNEIQKNYDWGQKGVKFPEPKTRFKFWPFINIVIIYSTLECI